MKKIFVTMIAVFSMAVINAQDIKSSKGENYLPEQGDWSIAFNADGLLSYVGNAFNGNTSNGVGVFNQKPYGTRIVGKRMDTDKTATRAIAGFRFGSNSTTDNSVDKVETVNSTTNFGISAGLGKEWRKGKTRLQGYYGADVLVNLDLVKSGSTKTVDTRTSTTTTVDTSVSNGFGFGLGARGFLGAEYFIFPKVALGAEYSYGVNLTYNSGGKSETVTTVGSNTTTTKAEGASGFSFNAGNGAAGATAPTSYGVGVVSFNLTLYF